LGAFFGHSRRLPSEGAARQILCAPCRGVYRGGLPQRVNVGPTRHCSDWCQQQTRHEVSFSIRPAEAGPQIACWAIEP
jgi:hypothetical protein